MTQPASAALVDLPEWPAEILELRVALCGWLRRLHGFPELPGLLADSVKLPLHEPPGRAPRVARDGGRVRAGQVAGARLITGARPATITTALPREAALAAVCRTCPLLMATSGDRRASPFRPRGSDAV
jgi:hypothetical protein